MAGRRNSSTVQAGSYRSKNFDASFVDLRLPLVLVYFFVKVKKNKTCRARSENEIGAVPGGAATTF